MEINLKYEDMVNNTVSFYMNLGVSIPKKYIKIAVASLTMPDFAYCYNSKQSLLSNKNKIHDHTALATVGDAVLSAYLMIKKYEDGVTKDMLTNEKQILKNDHLNIVGEKLLKNNLFAYNNDIKDGNKKDYATAFEAVIGFISLLGIKKVFKILDERIEM